MHGDDRRARARTWGGGSVSGGGGCAFAPLTMRGALQGGFDVAVGDVVRSEYGRTVRTVVAVEGGRAVLLGKTGAVESVPAEIVSRCCRKVG